MKSDWVVAELAAMRLALPVGMVVCALPRPAERTALGRRRGALCEVITHQGRAVPVLDLALWVDLGPRPEGRSANQYVLVLRQEARTVGVLVDSVDGVVTLQDEALVRLHHDNDHEELFHSVAQAEGQERLLSVLDVSRLMALAGVWSNDIEAVQMSAENSVAPVQDSQNEDWAVLECGAIRLAVRARDVGELLTMPALERLPGSGVAGICMWRNRHVPVLDGAALLCQASEQGGHRLLLTLCSAGLALGLAVDRVVHLRSIGTDAEAQSLRADTPGFVRAIVLDDGVPLHLLDTSRLIDLFPEASMSRVESSSGGPSVAPTQERSNASAYVVYQAANMVASPIDGLEEVLAAKSLPGASMEWRGKALPVIDLRADTTITGHLLVLRHEGLLAAMLVERIESLVTPHTGRLSKVALPGARFDMLTTGSGDEQASYRVLDLGAIAVTHLTKTSQQSQADPI